MRLPEESRCMYWLRGADVDDDIWRYNWVEQRERPSDWNVKETYDALRSAGGEAVIGGRYRKPFTRLGAALEEEQGTIVTEHLHINVRDDAARIGRYGGSIPLSPDEEALLDAVRDQYSIRALGTETRQHETDRAEGLVSDGVV